MTNEHLVKALWIRRSEGGPMEAQTELTIETGAGIGTTVICVFPSTGPAGLRNAAE